MPPRRMRLAVAAAVLMPLSGVFFVGRLSAQPGFRGGMPPFPPAGPIDPPPRQVVFETIWKCGQCGAELGRGGDGPPVDQCPRCAARVGNPAGFVNPPGRLTPAAALPSEPYHSIGTGWIVFGILGSFGL